MRIKSNILYLTFLTAMIAVGCSEISAPGDDVPPMTPRNFTLIGGGDGQAHFRWERNSEIDLKEYRLFRAVNNMNSFNILVSIKQAEYVDHFLDYDSTYYYYLTATDYAGNESLPTNIIDVQPLNISAPQPPSRLDVAGYNNPLTGVREIQLSWLPPNNGDLKNYQIYRAESSSFTPDESTFIDSTNIAVFADKSIQPNRTYYYKIVAVDRGGKKSLPSAVSSDVVLSSPLLISPANNSKFGTPHIFKWQKVTDAVSYEVFAGTGALTGAIWSSGKINATEINYTGPTLETAKIYYWWVAAYSKEKIEFEDGSELPAKINSYSLVNGFFVE